MGSHTLLGAVVSIVVEPRQLEETAMSRTFVALVTITLLGLCAAAEAQVDLSGTWAARNSAHVLDNMPAGAYPVEYQGIPLNEFGRARALIYSSSMGSMPDRICALYAPIYLMVGPFGLKIWNETEPRNGGTVAWHIGGWEDLAPITIWMDGRSHPSAFAPHETGGFTTGRWDNNVLIATTTHMRAGLLRRNGVPSSDEAVMTTRFFRHGDVLTVTARIDDPIYLAEPYYLTRLFRLSEGAPEPTAGVPCLPADEGVKEGVVPHHLPGANPFVDEQTKKYNIPQEVVFGGPETMYPDIRKRLRDRYVIPPDCRGVVCGGPTVRFRIW